MDLDKAIKINELKDKAEAAEMERGQVRAKLKEKFIRGKKGIKKV